MGAPKGHRSRGESNHSPSSGEFDFQGTTAPSTSPGIPLPGTNPGTERRSGVRARTWWCQKAAQGPPKQHQRLGEFWGGKGTLTACGAGPKRCLGANRAGKQLPLVQPPRFHISLSSRAVSVRLVTVFKTTGCFSIPAASSEPVRQEESPAPGVMSPARGGEGDGDLLVEFEGEVLVAAVQLRGQRVRVLGVHSQAVCREEGTPSGKPEDPCRPLGPSQIQRVEPKKQQNPPPAVPRPLPRTHRSRPSPPRTGDDLGVDVEGVVGGVDAPFAVVLLAQHEGRLVAPALPSHVGVAADGLVGDGQVLAKETPSGAAHGPQHLRAPPRARFSPSPRCKRRGRRGRAGCRRRRSRRRRPRSP